MGTSNYSDEFKRDAVQQIRVRGYPVREVFRRLGVSSHSLYKWIKQFGGPVSTAEQNPANGRRKPGHSNAVRGDVDGIIAWARALSR
jgi:transposase-like protein